MTIDENLAASVRALGCALREGRSVESCLALWSRLIRRRDGDRCLLCDATTGLAAHHICRKSFLPSAQFDTGNGITLCRECHKQPHAGFNRRPNLQLPMDHEGGEKIELLWHLYQVLLNDAVQRSMLCEELYGLNELTIAAFRKLQGIAPEERFHGPSLKQACQIWRQTPRQMIDAMLASLGLHRPSASVQTGPVMLYFDGDEASDGGG